MLGLGCGGLRPTIPGLPQDSLEVNALRLYRLDQASRRLGVEGIEVALSARREPGAWSRPRGPIEVSRALVDLVDDDELAAAIAHELGHLHADGTWRRPLASLSGDASRDAEMRADELGCRILASRGVPPAASVGLLQKLAASVRGGLAERIARARAVCGTLGASSESPR